ncbi:MAG: class I SAM-dependent methyltransferase [Anaerolineales bacterium]|nr:class I SAM-dependent methyltransferase [Anaerolineales bacterium]
MEEIARYYHLQHQDYKEDLPFWAEIAKKAGNGQILELGCGTGRVLSHLLNGGHTITGLDMDSGMLMYCAQEVLVPDYANKPPLVQGDMRRLPVAGVFSLVILPCNTYSIFSQEERKGILQEVKRVLSPTGLFVVSIPNLGYLMTLSDENDEELEQILILPNEDPVQVSSSWEKEGHTFTLHWHYDHLFLDGRVERNTVSTSHYLTPLDNLLEEFAQEGFICEEFYGDFDKEEFSNLSDNYIFVLRHLS